MARLNVVFDFGAVLFTWQPNVLVREYFPDHAATDEAATLLAKSLFSHPDWQAFDAGTVSMHATIERAQQRTDLPICQLRNLVNDIGTRLAPIDSSVQVLRSLHQRRAAGEDLKLYFLSNMPEPYARTLEAKHEFISWFDDGIFSGDVKLIKPDAAIYAMANKRFGLQGRTVFIDDLQANIEASQAHGWHGVHLAQPHMLSDLLVTKLT